MLAKPDPSTFQILPWRGEGRVDTRMFCDIVMPDGSPSYADPRFVLKRTLSKAAEGNFTFYTHPEIEFYLFKDTPQPGADPGARGPQRLLRPHRAELGGGLPAAGDHDAGVDGHLGGSHHEAAPASQEIDLRYADMSTADNIMTFRTVVHEVAYVAGHLGDLHAQAVHHPPRVGHAHPRVAVRGDRSAFFSAGSEYQLSKTGRSFIAGILTHAAEITAVTNQWVNSYKRLIGGGEARRTSAGATTTARR